MYYASLRELLQNVIEFQENTPSTLYGATSEREARLSHYYDRAAHEVWHARPWWPFRHAQSQLTLANGQVALPANFDGIGQDGYVVPSPSGTGQLPWVEVNYQELLAMRNNNVWPARYQQNRVYAIGAPVPVVTNVEADASNGSGDSYDFNASNPTGFSGLGFAVGMRITISGFVNAGNNGTFDIITEITPDEQYRIQNVAGTTWGGAENGVFVDVGVTYDDRLSLLSGNPGDDRTIVVYHDIQLPVTDPTNDLDKPIPFPGYCHHALYAGTTWHVNRSVHDRRAARMSMEFRRDFDQALSDAIRMGRPKQNRPQQMPMSVGRMW